MRALFGSFTVLLLLVGCSPGRDSRVTPGTPSLKAMVVAKHPHDPTSFTEGLVFDAAGSLYESAGGYGTSDVREVEPSTGAVLRREQLDPSLFGEGLAVVDRRLVQLTWRENLAITWEADTLVAGPRQTFEGEGWGLTSTADGRLVQSDGSSKLTIRDPSDFSAQGAVVVKRDGRAVEMINELEMVGDVLWANVWKTSEILRIDPDTGAVTGVADLSGIVPEDLDPDSQVLNGIAHHPGDSANRLWVTGKDWPTMYEIEVIET